MSKHAFDYRPWAVLQDLEFPTPEFEADGWTHMRLWWLAAQDAEAAIVTGRVVSYINSLALRATIEPDAASEVERRTYDPPLVRFVCPACHDDWDAWVADDGHLEDPRNQNCARSECARFGQPAELRDG